MPFDQVKLTRLFPFGKATPKAVNGALDEIENYINGLVDPNAPQTVLPSTGDGGGVLPNPAPVTAVTSIQAVAPIAVSANTGDVVIWDAGGSGVQFQGRKAVSSSAWQIGAPLSPSAGTFVTSEIQWGSVDGAGYGDIDLYSQFGDPGFTANTSGYYLIYFQVIFDSTNTIASLDEALAAWLVVNHNEVTLPNGALPTRTFSRYEHDFAPGGSEVTSPTQIKGCSAIYISQGQTASVVMQYGYRITVNTPGPKFMEVLKIG